MGKGRGGHPFEVDLILGQTHGAEAETEGEALAEGFLAVIEAGVAGDPDLEEHSVASTNVRRKQEGNA